MQRIAQQNATKAARQAEAANKALAEMNARTQYTQKYAKKRFELEKYKEAAAERRRQRDLMALYKKTLTAPVKEARKARKEDWELGPLAPKRDVGENTDKFGTVDGLRQSPPAMPERTRKWERHLAQRNRYEVHDRVVVLKGRDAGKIGEITHLHEESMTVTIKGINMVDYVPPDWMKEYDRDNRPVREAPAPIPMRDIRLVYPVRNRHTRKTKEVIVGRMKFRVHLVEGEATDEAVIHAGKAKVPVINPSSEDAPQFFQRRSRDFTLRGYKLETVRLIPGLNQEITNVKGHEDTIENEEPYYDCDTLLIQTEEETFMPKLMEAPMPLSVIDELRNKYSKFRDRHDEDWIQAKAEKAMKEEAEKVERELKMRTPLQELKERRKEVEMLEEGRRVLKKELLAKIGEVMAKNGVVDISGRRKRKTLALRKQRAREAEIQTKIAKKAPKKIFGPEDALALMGREAVVEKKRRRRPMRFVVKKQTKKAVVKKPVSTKKKVEEPVAAEKPVEHGSSEKKIEASV